MPVHPRGLHGEAGHIFAYISDIIWEYNGGTSMDSMEQNNWWKENQWSCLVSKRKQVSFHMPAGRKQNSSL